jgi:hypothetical protein
LIAIGYIIARRRKTPDLIVGGTVALVGIWFAYAAVSAAVRLMPPPARRPGQMGVIITKTVEQLPGARLASATITYVNNTRDGPFGRVGFQCEARDGQNRVVGVEDGSFRGHFGPRDTRHDTVRIEVGTERAERVTCTVTQAE